MAAPSRRVAMPPTVRAVTSSHLEQAAGYISHQAAEEVTVNKTELIGKISEVSALSRREAEMALDSTLYAISSAVKSGDAVRITGFGTFKLRPRAARTGRNPQTGAAVRIKASNGIAFAAGATLKDQLNTRGAIPKPGGATAAPAKAAPAAKAPAKKAPAAKAPAKKAPAAKKVPAKKAAAKKAPAKKAHTAKAAGKTTRLSEEPTRLVTTFALPTPKYRCPSCGADLSRSAGHRRGCSLGTGR
jgi:DNA-binding protein HU-beta